MGRQQKGSGSKKRNNFHSSGKSTPKSKSKSTDDADALWEDEIDAFHQQRDVIPLDAQLQASDDEDPDDHPVFDLQDDDDDDEDDDDDSPPRGFAAKIARQAKYLKQKFGGAEDEMDDDHDHHSDQEQTIKSWGGRKNIYYNADTADFENQSTDEDLPKEEEAEVLRIQRDKAKSLSMADLGLQDTDQDQTDSDSDSEDDKSKRKSRRDTLDASYEKIKKDIGALSKEEQMDVVFSSAPELIGLLSELNEAVDQLKEVKADDGKVNGEVDIGKTKMEQSEVKEALLLMYCQAISFYLLLKSEGLSVRDHPVISRLVEIKNMLKKLKEFEERFPSPAEKIADVANKADSCKIAHAQVTQQQVSSLKMASRDEILMLESITKQKLVKENPRQNAKQKDKDVKIGSQSLEMLKIRADLEAKLREKGLYNGGAKPKLKNSLSTKPTDRQSFMSRDDFDDEVQYAKISSKSKLSHVVMNKTKKAKLTSGDDDLPKRDDIGERRRKHELRVLGRIGADNNSDDDVNHDNHDNNDDEEHGDVPDDDQSDDDASEDEFYKEAKRKHSVKLVTRQQLNAAKQIVPSMDEEEQQAAGKRQISYQMDKNKGLTRHRKKELKNPRKKYRAKHKKWEERRKGQVRSIRRPSGSYGGESSGINPSVSHSVRF